MLACIAGPLSAQPDPDYLGNVLAEELTEISGLASSRHQPGVIWAIQDSGNGNKIYALSSTGEKLATVIISDAQNYDWEDLVLWPQASGADRLLIADIGDNGGVRKRARLYAVEEPDLSGLPQDNLQHQISIVWQQDFVYDDAPHDAESIELDLSNQKVLILTKRLNPNRLYTVSLNSAVQLKTAERVAEIHGLVRPDPDTVRNSIPAIRWDGQPTAMRRIDDYLAILTYRKLYWYPWASAPADRHSWSRALSAPLAVYTLPLLPQVESLTEINGKALITSEKRPAPMMTLPVPVSSHP